MKAVIIHENMEFAAKAYATLRRVGCRDEMNVQWTVNCWPVDTLNNPIIIEKALAEARDAHLIVLPANLAQSIPLWLLRWLERWAMLRHIQEAALGILEHTDTSRTEMPVHPQLLAFVRRHGLTLIGNEFYANDPVAEPVQAPPGGLFPLLVGQAVFNNSVLLAPYRSFGINE